MHQRMVWRHSCVLQCGNRGGAGGAQRRTAGVGGAALLHSQEGAVAVAVRNAAPGGALGVVGDANELVAGVQRCHPVGHIRNALRAAATRRALRGAMTPSSARGTV